MMQDTNFDTEELKSLEVYDAAEMLGVYLAADGNNDEQVEELREKGEKWADQVRSGYMNRYEAWLSLTTTIMKSIEYPLPALTLAHFQVTRRGRPVWTPAWRITVPIFRKGTDQRPGKDDQSRAQN